MLAMSHQPRREIVTMNSGTLNTEGLNSLRARLAGELARLGFETENLPGGGMEVLTSKGGGGGPSYENKHMKEIVHRTASQADTVDVGDAPRSRRF